MNSCDAGSGFSIRLPGFFASWFALMSMAVLLANGDAPILAAQTSRNQATEQAAGVGVVRPASPVGGYQVVHIYPHDPEAFTQGLTYDAGRLYESTGRYGRSSIRLVELKTGKVIKSRSLPVFYFGEGLTLWGDRLIQLTWKSHTGFVYRRDTFETLGTFQYHGEGWGITRVGSLLVMSDGSAALRFLDAASLQEIKSLEVTDGGRPVMALNELEYINGEIFANVWPTDWIARISPETGRVVGWVDLAGLRIAGRATGKEDALNGIAYDAENDRIFVTGKLWPKLFEIRLVPPPSG